jgi:hypothetical protein
MRPIHVRYVKTIQLSSHIPMRRVLAAILGSLVRLRCRSQNILFPKLLPIKRANGRRQRAPCPALTQTPYFPASRSFPTTERGFKFHVPLHNKTSKYALETLSVRAANHFLACCELDRQAHILHSPRPWLSHPILIPRCLRDRVA